MKFSELKLDERILKNIDALKFTEMTKIQENVIPQVIEGHDILVKAQTGSGKTASYLVPIINKILTTKTHNSIKAIILVPTRDLVNQVYDTYEALAQGTDITCCKIMGGTNKDIQIKEVKDRPDIIIGVTGRFKDMISRDIITYKEIEFFVLDEVDKMLDLGFRSDILHIYHEIQMQNKSVQTLMLSATLPETIVDLSSKFLNDKHKRIDLEEDMVINDLIDQRFLVMHESNMMSALLKLVQTNNVRTIIFANTIQACNKIEGYLRLLGIDAASINGDRTQQYRDKVIQDFKDYKLSVLVSTDLLSRGIDIKDLDLVINYGLPEQLETYMHRIGRVGRNKTMGRAMSVIDLNEEEKMIKLIKGYDLRAKVLTKEAWRKPSKEKTEDKSNLY